MPFLSQMSESRRAWKIVFVVVVALLIVWIVNVSRKPNLIEWRGHTMGTTYSIKAVNQGLSLSELEVLREGVDELLEELNEQMSTYRPHSEISRFNRSESLDSFRVSPEFARVAKEALHVSERTGGAFDPTLDPLINLWGFGDRGRVDALPSEEAISELLPELGAEYVEVLSTTEIRKRKLGIQLNVNAIAKGYAVDAVSDLLSREGLNHSFVEIGGEVRARGYNENGWSWRVGVEMPQTEGLGGATLAAALDLHDRAMATSGNYRNFVVGDDGRVLSHILDPRNGYPVAHRLASVSVVADTCSMADGLATALFVMGPEEGLRWVEANGGIEALFIVSDGEDGFVEVASAGFFSRSK